MKRSSSILLFAIFALFSNGVLATQSLEAIQSAAEAFVRSNLPSDAKHFVNASRLDPRLRLHECGAPLEAFSQHGGSNGARMTIGVRCTTANPWTLYVPVSVEVEVPVLVLRRALARRARIAPSDVEPQVRRLPGSATHFISDVTRLQGHRLQRALPAGAAITVDVLKPDLLVKRGQRVILIAAEGPVEIRAQGQALNDGAVNERVRVQNVTPLKVVEGVVESDSVVRILF